MGNRASCFSRLNASRPPFVADSGATTKQEKLRLNAE